MRRQSRRAREIEVFRIREARQMRIDQARREAKAQQEAGR
jgi:hypothetical protein